MGEPVSVETTSSDARRFAPGGARNRRQHARLRPGALVARLTVGDKERIVGVDNLSLSGAGLYVDQDVIEPTGVVVVTLTLGVYGPVSLKAESVHLTETAGRRILGVRFLAPNRDETDSLFRYLFSLSAYPPSAEAPW